MKVGKYQVHQSDANSGPIVDALKAGGWSVYKIGRPLDLVIGKGGDNVLVEIKQPKGKLRATQEAFIKSWPGRIYIFRTVEDVLWFLKHG